MATPPQPRATRENKNNRAKPISRTTLLFSTTQRPPAAPGARQWPNHPARAPGSRKLPYQTNPIANNSPVFNASARAPGPLLSHPALPLPIE